MTLNARGMCLLTASVLVLSASCDRSTSAEVSAAGKAAASTALPIQKTEAQLERRGRERWELIARGDWISAYEYLNAEQRQRLALPDYLSGKDVHKYGAPTVERVVAIEGPLGYLRVRAFWTPDHPAMKGLPADQRGAALTQELPMVETWHWDGDDWYFLRAQDVEEFEADNPTLAGR